MTNNNPSTEAANNSQKAAERNAIKRETNNRATITPKPSPRAIGESKHRAFIEIPVGADQAAVTAALQELLARTAEPVNAPTAMATESHICSRRFGVGVVAGQLVPFEQV